MLVKVKMKNSKTDYHHQPEQKIPYEIPRISLKFLSYLIDFSLLFSLVTYMLSFFNVFPASFEIVARYQLGMRPLIPGNLEGALVVFIIFYTFTAFVYFLFEPILSGTVGKYILGLRTANIVFRSPDNSRMLPAFNLIRAMVKAIPPAQLVDSIFSLKDKYSRTALEKASGFVTVSVSNKHKAARVLAGSAIVYYIPLLVMSLIVGYTAYLAGTSSPPTSASFAYKPTWSEVSGVFQSNFNLDLGQYLYGGPVLMTLDILETITDGYTSSLFIGGSLSSNPSFLIYGVLPHFFIETMGYVAGIAAAFYISSIMIDAVKGYFLSQPVSYLSKVISSNLLKAGEMFLLSLFLLILGAITETFLTSYLLHTYYYNILANYNIVLP